jgi:hypothetical protein
MNFKKALLTTLSTIMVGGVVLSANQNTSQFEPQAAVTETKRVWAIARTSFWFDGGVSFGVSTTTGFIGASAQNYTTYIMQRDVNNNDFGAGGTEFSGSQAHAYYVDVPTNITHVEFFREASPASRFNYSGWSLYTAGMKYILENVSTAEFAGFAFNTTKVVEDFANSIDTIAEVCTSGQAQTAINTYNGMATFEQNQFDVLAVSEGVTGLQRLEYLRSRFSIATALN